MRRCDDEEEKKLVINNIVGSCHSNWLRITYSGKEIQNFVIPPLTPLIPVPTIVPKSADKLFQRFKQAIKYLPGKVVHNVLQRLERDAVLHASGINECSSHSDEEFDYSQVDNTSSDDPDDSENSSSEQHVRTIRNPPRRRKRKFNKDI